MANGAKGEGGGVAHRRPQGESSQVAARGGPCPLAAHTAGPALQEQLAGSWTNCQAVAPDVIMARLKDAANSA